MLLIMNIHCEKRFLTGMHGRSRPEGRAVQLITRSQSGGGQAMVCA
jgi:hypothetical protein